MTAFKAPELASAFGAIDSDAAGDGRVMPAHVLREMIRSANLLMARGSQMFRWVGSTRQNPTELGPGSARHFLAPFWRPLIPIENWPVPKKPGLTEGHIRIQARATNLSQLTVQVATLENGNFEERPDSSKTFSITGTGADAQYGSGHVIRLRPEADEVISIYARADVDLFNDTDLVTGTYGGAASGTVTSEGRGQFWDSSLSGTPFNTTAPFVHEGGHYVFFTQTDTDGVERVIHGPALVVDTWRSNSQNGEGLFFWPHTPSYLTRLTGTTYRIKQLPLIRLDGIAIYSMDRAVTP